MSKELDDVLQFWMMVFNIDNEFNLLALKPYIEKFLKQIYAERWIAVAYEAVKLPLKITSSNLFDL